MAAQETRQVEEDLTYIRGAVERMEDAPYESVTIAVLWAVIITGGFSINDFRPEFSMIYWPVASITGYLINLLIGRRAAAEAGECSSPDTRMHALHWGSIFFLSIAVLVDWPESRTQWLGPRSVLHPRSRRRLVSGGSPSRPSIHAAGCYSDRWRAGYQLHTALSLDNRRSGDRDRPRRQRCQAEVFE